MRTKLAGFFSIPLNEELRFRVRDQRNNGRESHHFIDILFDGGTVHSHIFQAGTASDQTKLPDVLGVLKQRIKLSMIPIHRSPISR